MYALVDTQKHIRALLEDARYWLANEEDEEIKTLLDSLLQSELEYGEVHTDNGGTMHSVHPVSPGDEHHSQAIHQELKRRGWGVVHVPDGLDSYLREILPNIKAEDHSSIVRALVNLGDSDIEPVKNEVKRLADGYRELRENREEWEKALDAKREEIKNRGVN